MDPGSGVRTKTYPGFRWPRSRGQETLVRIFFHPDLGSPQSRIEQQSEIFLLSSQIIWVGSGIRTKNLSRIPGPDLETRVNKHWSKFFFHSGSRIPQIPDPITIRNFLSSQKIWVGSEIRDLDKNLSRIPDPDLEVNNTGSRIRIRNTVAVTVY